MEKQSKNWSNEVGSGDRFQFGKNWRSFLREKLSEERIALTRESLVAYLGTKNLTGKRFIDVGCGSGIFSLAACQMGAEVFSFDYDKASVQCANYLKKNYFEEDVAWCVEEGSILDTNYINKLGQFDIVYSWGVLHHTGDMYKAFENIVKLVKCDGKLFISIYNDQGFKSLCWKKIKKSYCKSSLAKPLIGGIFFLRHLIRTALIGLIKMRNLFFYFLGYGKQRGMSFTHDFWDWLGGYPFEVAKPEDIFYFFSKKNFQLSHIKTTNSLGCNEFVFSRGVYKS